MKRNYVENIVAYIMTKLQRFYSRNEILKLSYCHMIKKSNIHAPVLLNLLNLLQDLHFISFPQLV